MCILVYTEKDFRHWPKKGLLQTRFCLSLKGIDQDIFFEFGLKAIRLWVCGVRKVFADSDREAVEMYILADGATPPRENGEIRPCGDDESFFEFVRKRVSY